MASGLQLGIVSSNSESNVRTVLGPSNALHFTHYQCGVSLLGKAAKLRRVARVARLPANRVLYVGDELRDLEAAGKAGLPFAAVTWGCSRAAAFETHRPQAIFQSVAEMRRFLTQ